MSTSGRGRARGAGAPRRGEEAIGRGARFTTASSARPPSRETISRFGVTLEKDTENGQFDDVTEGEAAKEATPAAETSTAPQISTVEGSKTSIEASPANNEGEFSSFSPKTPDLSPGPTKLDPSAAEFNPKGSLSSSSSKLDPNSPEFSPTAQIPVNSVSTSHTYTQPPPSHITAAQLKLDPRSAEFVPKIISPLYAASSANSSLSPSAPEFVPRENLPSSMQNGQMSDDIEDPVPSVGPNAKSSNEEEPPSLKPNDIISGCKYPFDQTSDMANESVLKAAADMLIKLTIYPGSFERGKVKLENTVKAWLPTGETLANLAEMLVHWGLTEPSLSLSSSRICQVFNDMEILKGAFRTQMAIRLQHWFKERTRSKLLNFSLFYAEIFSRLKMSNRETPIYNLGLAVQTLITELLEDGNEKSVIGACQILKLTGPLLAAIKKEDTKMGTIISTLEKLATDETLPLSSKCVEIVVRVLELHARQWGNPVRPLTSAAAPSTLNEYMFGSGEAVSGPVGDEEAAGFLVPPEPNAVHQAPVSNPEEWNEFLDDDNEPIEDSDVPQGFVMAGGSGQDEELDEEMQKEFEFFVQDLEEHLLNIGEMDPEQFQEEQ